jgi:cell division protein FtsZ
MIRSGLEGVEFIVCNTDAQALQQSLAETRIQMGPQVTQGLGAGSRPDVGKAAAEESLEEIMGHLKGVNMIFITAGMGGGTGTGGAPVIARAARDAGILTIGVVTRPFHFEGAHRTQTAEKGVEEMNQAVDTLLVIPNQNLFRLATERTTFSDAFAMADDVLYSGVRTFTDLMIRHGLINLDFADICAVMREMMGKAMMGTGQASGERRAIDAAEQAISCPLLDNDVSMKGARAVLINISGGPDMTLFEVDEAASRIREEVDPAANIIFGATFDESLSGELRVAVVATGIDAKEQASVGFSSEGRVHTMPGSVFKLGGAAENKGKTASELAQASDPAQNDPFMVSQAGLGHRHDPLPETVDETSNEVSESLFGSKEGASGWPTSRAKSAHVKLASTEPEKPVKRRAFSLLERLGMKRAASESEEKTESTTVVSPALSLKKGGAAENEVSENEKKEETSFLDTPPQEASVESDIPAFMREESEKRKRAR